MGHSCCDELRKEKLAAHGHPDYDVLACRPHVYLRFSLRATFESKMFITAAFALACFEDLGGVLGSIV